jgi:hypothetical protein
MVFLLSAKCFQSPARQTRARHQTNSITMCQIAQDFCKHPAKFKLPNTAGPRPPTPRTSPKTQGKKAKSKT